MKGLFAKLIVTFLLPSLCFGAVAFNTSASAAVSPSTSQSVPITVGAGSNRVLIVTYFFDSNAVAGSAPTGAGATWGSVADGTCNPSAPVNGRMEVWVGKNPSTGAQTVVGNLSPSGQNSVEVESYNGVNQTTPVSGFACQRVATNPILQTLTTTNGDAVEDNVMSTSQPLGSAAGGCNGTNDATSQAPSANWFVTGHCLASGSSTTIGQTNPGANAGQISFVINQVASATATPQGFLTRIFTLVRIMGVKMRL